MTALQIEQRREEPAFRNVAIVAREPSMRGLLRSVAKQLVPDEAARLETAGVGSSDRAVAQDIARRAEAVNADVVVMTVDDARVAAARVLARGSAVLAVPPAWRPGAGAARIAVGYDGSEPADAAVEATRAIVTALRGGVSGVELIHVDDSASSAGEIDADVVNSRRTAVIGWWLEQVGRAIPTPVGVIRAVGDPVASLAELSHDFDLLVVGTHGRGSIRRIVGPSLTRELIEATQCPVLIVPRSCRCRWKPAESELVGWSPDDPGVGAEDLTRRALPGGCTTLALGIRTE